MSDVGFMRAALAEAEKALAMDEVPVGAVVVAGGEIIGRGHNRRETEGDPTAHAEILALREAARRRGHWRLHGTTLYVTLEPCPMCAGALVNARVDRLVFGAIDPKAGAAGTLFNLVEDPRLNHRLEVTGGVLGEEAAELLRRFFRLRRGEGANSPPYPPL
ncbi:MAG: tRNA adenosine(34) deaminase TadA [Firmicutes bacterium]|nr:tRNA adenosine(34) deaminase TadA [Bacillota bacterium]